MRKALTAMRRRTAVVIIPAASEPLPGSVSPHAASHSPVVAFERYFCFCASLPNASTCPVPSPLCEATVSASESSTLAISSTATAYATVSIADPP